MDTEYIYHEQKILTFRDKNGLMKDIFINKILYIQQINSSNYEIIGDHDVVMARVSPEQRAEIIRHIQGDFISLDDKV